MLAEQLFRIGQVNIIADCPKRCDINPMAAGSNVGRFKRIVRIASTALAALGAMTGTPGIAQKNQHIIAVGDLHGDLQAWLTIAKAAGVMTPDGHWAGGSTTLVQLGDITDRGPDSLAIIRSLQQLQREASAKGGNVVVVLGNHEAMMVIGDYRYTTPGEYAAFTDDRSTARRERVYMANRKQLEAAAHATDPKALPSDIRDRWLAQTPLGWVEHRIAWSPTGELGKWAAKNPAILKIGTTLFAHGGISAEYARSPIEDVNRRVAAAITAGDDKPTSILTDPLGPLWYRGLVTSDADAQAERAAMKLPPAPLTAEAELDSVLTAYGAKRLVVAHTPSLKGIIISPDAKLARIDTGISNYYGGPLSWLEIIGDRMVPHTVARSP